MKNTVSLETRISKIVPQIEGLLGHLDAESFSYRALTYVAQRLEEMRRECEACVLTQQKKSEGELARIVVETDPNILDPEIGKEIILIEKEYYKM